MGRKRLEELVDEHGAAAMRVVVGVLGRCADADDAWQETWLSISTARNRLRTETSPWPFIRTTALRKALDRLRAKRNGPADLASEPTARLAAPAPEIDLGRLPERERIALTLFFWEGMSVTEIAEALDRPAGTIKTWMHRGRERLRRSLLDRLEAP